MEKQTILDMCEYLEIQEDVQDVVVCYLKKELQNFFFIDTNLYGNLDHPYLLYKIVGEETSGKTIVIEPTERIDFRKENCLKIEMTSIHHQPIIFFQKITNQLYRIDEFNMAKSKPYLQTSLYKADDIYDNILLAKVKNLSSFNLTKHLNPIYYDQTSLLSSKKEKERYQNQNLTLLKKHLMNLEQSNILTEFSKKENNSRMRIRKE